MPDIDSHIFSAALTVFLFFGAANLTLELIISFVLVCKKLKATVKSPCDLETRKLRPSSSTQAENGQNSQADLLLQLIALNPTQRQAIASLLKTLSTTESADTAKTTNPDSQAVPAEIGRA